MAQLSPNPNQQDRNVEEPGDTDAPDIVGRTGEEMPRQSHDGLDESDRSRPRPDSDEDDEELDGYPV
jgi:hypothetical protein